MDEWWKKKYLQLTHRMKHTPTTFPRIMLLKEQIAGVILVSFSILHAKRKYLCKLWLFFEMVEIKGDVQALQSVLLHWYVWQWRGCTQGLGCKEMTYCWGFIDTQVFQSHGSNEQARLSSWRRPSELKETQSVKICSPAAHVSDSWDLKLCVTLVWKWTVSLMQLLPSRPLSSILLSWSHFIFQVESQTDRSVCWSKLCVFFWP